MRPCGTCRRSPPPVSETGHFVAVAAKGSRRVAVGTAIADRPPHRSVRAALPHTAPTSDGWRQSAHRDRDAPTGAGERDVLMRPVHNRLNSRGLAGRYDNPNTLHLGQAGAAPHSFCPTTNCLSMIYDVCLPAIYNPTGQSCRDSRRPECWWDAPNRGPNIPLCPCFKPCRATATPASMKKPSTAPPTTGISWKKT